jgi:hypothetical protein
MTKSILLKIKLNITESANCQCGERETIEHYILHCDQYEEAREKLIHDMFLLSGSMHLSLEVLLTVGADEEVSLTETQRIRILADYLASKRAFRVLLLELDYPACNIGIVYAHVQFTLGNFNTLLLLIGGH